MVSLMQIYQQVFAQPITGFRSHQSQPSNIENQNWIWPYDMQRALSRRLDHHRILEGREEEEGDFFLGGKAREITMKGNERK